MRDNHFGRRQSESLLWVVSGQIIWAVHFVAVYVVLSLGCFAGYGLATTAGLYTINLVLIGLTVPFLVVIAFLGVQSWRYWRAQGAEGGNEEANPRRFMALAATLIHVVSLVAVLYVALPIFISPPCV